jgi:8-oxo-dGTP pyrophosphatase MutT (NUDIX family)
MKRVVSGVCIRKNMILLVKKNDFWILPGGKLEGVETKEECLKRELAEELPKSEFKIGEPYKNFTGETPTTKKTIFVNTFFIILKNKDISCASEISDSRFFNLDEAEKLNISNVTCEIIEKLIEDGFLIETFFAKNDSLNYIDFEEECIIPANSKKPV